MKETVEWRICIELNISFDDGLSYITSYFVRELLSRHPTALVETFDDDGAIVSVSPTQLESLLLKLQAVSTPVNRISFAVRAVLVESDDYDDDDGIFGVSTDDTDDTFFVLREESPLVLHLGGV